MFPLLWLSSIFLLGLAINGTFQTSRILWAGGFFVSLVLSLVEWRFFNHWDRFKKIRRRLPVPLGVIFCAFFLGGLRFPALQISNKPDALVSYNNRQVIVTGMVSDAPKQSLNSQSLRLQVSQVWLVEGIPADVQGTIQIQTTNTGAWEYGDRLSLTGHLIPAAESGSASYRSYLERQGISSLMYYPQIVLLQTDAGDPLQSTLFELRAHAYRTILRMFPQPEGALLAGILLGMEDELPDALVKAYQATGTAHIFAISGFNIAIVAGVFTTLFKRWFARWQAALLAVAAIALYTLMVGATPSVLRAAIMGSLGIVAQLIGRRSASLTTLMFTAAVMCVINPHLPWDVSFQLSFMATLGLMLFADPLERSLETWLEKRVPAEKVRAWSRPIVEYFLLTLAAQAMTLPVLAYHFHRLSLSGLIANPLVLPAQPLAMILGGLAVLIGMVFLPLGRLLGWLAWPLAAYTNRMVAWLATLSGEFATGSISIWTILALYLLIFLMIGSLRKWKKDLTAASLTMAVGLVCVLVWRAVLTAPDGRLNVFILGVQDDSVVYLQTPGGNSILIDASAAYEELGSALDARISLFHRHLDAVIISQPDPARLNGVSTLMENLPVRQIYWTCAASSRAAERVVANLLQARGEQDVLEQGVSLQLDSDVNLAVLIRTDDGAALQLTYGRLEVLIPGGISLEALEGELGTLLQNVDVLILTDEDLVDTPVAAWDDLRSLVFWAEPQIEAPIEGWVSLYQKEWITLASDGQGVWLTGN